MALDQIRHRGHHQPAAPARGHDATTLAQLATANTSLASTNADAQAQGAGIATLQQCLAGIKSAFNEIADQNNTQAAQDISAVSAPCTELTGGAGSGLVYPFDFPDPDIILVGNTYYGFATNSAAGNIQIIESSDLDPPGPRSATCCRACPGGPLPCDTWAPAVAQFGGKFLLYYATMAGRRTAGQECISVATAPQPEGPFIDKSTAPLECQQALGGSIDPSPFVDTNGALYLDWKSGGPGNSRLWSQALDPTGKAFAFASRPAEMLVPDQSWQGGTVEAPDMVTAGGRYFLFYSGNDWNRCLSMPSGWRPAPGPSGRAAGCLADTDPRQRQRHRGPGGESASPTAPVPTGSRHARPRAVGFPEQPVLTRRLSFSGPLPVVGSPT